MCGIAGQLARPGKAPRPDLVRAMARTLSHRGPDGEGFHFDGRAAIGHRRLSFIDLARGNQPLTGEDGSVSLVCNGEIYNFIELRRDLEARGHAFRTGSDCEVIVHLYEEQGVDAFSKLEGMFAVALWDSKRDELILARDPFGIKPLHYARTPSGLFFASELKALLLCDVDRSVNALALHDYLTSLSVRDSDCILAAVKKVPPGTCLRFSGDNDPVETRFWNVPAVRERDDDAEADLVEELRAALGESVAMTLRSDVPVGLFLSGGVDSSAVAATWPAGVPAQSFCLGFEERAFDESEHAAAVARHLGLRHESVRLTRRDAVPLVQRLCASLDEPFGDASAIPTLMLSSFARERVKAVLSGEGADELFGGNFWHLPRPTMSPADPMPYGQGIAFASAEAARICREAAGHVRPPRNADDRPSHRDIETYLPSDLLVKMDRVPMMAGLEVRVPFLNRRVADLALSIPWRFHIRNGIGKALLKKCIEARVPPDVVNRPKKGFGVPLDAWLWEDGALRELVRDVIFSDRAGQRGYFDRRELERMFHEHDHFKRLHGHRIWLIFVFEMWCRQLIDVF